jgi:hypothetical protein
VANNRRAAAVTRREPPGGVAATLSLWIRTPDIQIFSPATLGTPPGQHSQITRVADHARRRSRASQITRVNATSRCVFVAGRLATDQAGNVVDPDDLDMPSAARASAISAPRWLTGSPAV